VGATTAAYSEQHGRGQPGDWTRGNVSQSVTRSISVLNTLPALRGK